jgi:DNA-binding transcriptional LysR family regulator
VSLRGARVALTANNVVSLLHAAALGAGIAPLPTFLAAREPSLVRIWPEREDAQDAWLVVHHELRRAARVRVVMDAIAARFTAR